ncbi:MAG TPA: LamG domain-containing protein, partial [Armatimonadota bacterium]|nr:LamG domain-containing protein [Armatimonadota bacterium]
MELRFTGNGLDITVHYRLGANDHFIEKWLTIRASDGGPYLLKSVFLEDTTSEAFSEIHFHDDQTIWHCPINLFLRGEKGGCFAGLAYPYWELKQNGKEGFRLGYQPNYQAANGEANVSEKYFIGVYRKEGIHRVSQGPYPGRGRCKWLNWGGKAGLVQHFKGKQIPAEVRDVPLETLDWGEVWAMQELMRHVLPDDLPLPEDGFWIWQNGWWAGLWKIDAGILDLLKQAGIHDVMTAHTWYGRGNHPMSPPYIDQMRAQPMGFPKDSGIAGLPGPAGPAAGLHANHAEVKLDSFSPGEFTPEFIMPPAMNALYDHGQKIGVHVSSFSLPCVYFKDHPEWASIDEDGKVSEYLFGRKVSCPACDPYMDHTLEILDHVFSKYKPRWWGFDGRWLSYWEVPSYRPGPKGLGFDTCHATHHGHLPGDNLYKEWKNIQELVRALRLRHPKMCLEQYLGLKRGGPWALRYFNADDNYYETNGALMNRFQTWHNQNDRFRPVYKNYAAIFGGSPAEFRNSVISSISATSYCQVGPGYKDLAIEENRDFLRMWRAWATRNHAYLKVKRDLFDSPGDSPVDGSAHIIRDRGFLFLFPAGGMSARASIPISRWIQLDENAKALYQIREIYPREATDLGVYKYGAELLYDMPKGSAVILSLEPAPAGSKPRRPVLQEQPETLVVPAFRTVAQTAYADAP